MSAIDDRWSLWQRNVVDKFKDTPTDQIKEQLKQTALPGAVLVANVEGDFNLGCILRSTNFFNLSCFYYYGRKKIDRRSMLGTQHYTEIVHLPTLDDVIALQRSFSLVAADNNLNYQTAPLLSYRWQPRSLIVIGEENAGIPEEILGLCDDFVEIPGRGSVRSLNAATAAGIIINDYVSKVG